jgi:transglutaminase-like putative cysteine protease
MIRKLSISTLVIILFTPTLHAADPFNYTVPVKNFKPSIYNEKKSRYRIESSDTEFSLIETTYQKIVKQRIGNKKKIIEIQTGLIPRVSTTIEDLSGFLKDTRLLNLSSPEISGAAAKLRDTEDPVRGVEDFVYRHISDKTLGIPIIPASQVYRMKRGDCTEHCVLAVALLRKLRVPARAVAGMYLAGEFMGKRNVFVYHMWAEAFWKGHWRLVDATRPGEDRLNRYIAFTYHNLKAEAPLPYLRAISAIQDMTVEYIGK